MPQLMERSAVLAGAARFAPPQAETAPPQAEVWPPPLSDVVVAADAEARRHEHPLVQAVAAEACKTVLESPFVVDLTLDDRPRDGSARPVPAVAARA